MPGLRRLLRGAARDPRRGRGHRPLAHRQCDDRTSPIGGCQRLHALPAGSYRIDLPVYAFEADAAAKVLPRVVTQTFTLPAPDDAVMIPVGTAP